MGVNKRRGGEPIQGSPPLVLFFYHFSGYLLLIASGAVLLDVHRERTAENSYSIFVLVVILNSADELATFDDKQRGILVPKNVLGPSHEVGIDPGSTHGEHPTADDHATAMIIIDRMATSTECTSVDIHDWLRKRIALETIAYQGSTIKTGIDLDAITDDHRCSMIHNSIPLMGAIKCFPHIGTTTQMNNALTDTLDLVVLRFEFVIDPQVDYAQPP